MLNGAVFLVITLLQLITPGSAFAAEPEMTPTVYVFGDAACQLCRSEVKWLFDEGVPYQYLNIETDNTARQQYEALLQKHDLPRITPLTVVGSEIIVGYEKEQTTGRDIRRAITKAKKSDVVTINDHIARAAIMERPKIAACEGLDCDTTNLQALTDVPLLGLVNLRDASFLALSLILGTLSITTLLNLGWLCIVAGLLILAWRPLFVAVAGFGALLLELFWHTYFLNSGFLSSSRFLLDAAYAEVLRETVGFWSRQVYIILYSGAALIDVALVGIAVFLVLPLLEKLDDRHPGSIGMLASAFLFVGGACIAYFIKFG